MNHNQIAASLQRYESGEILDEKSLKELTNYLIKNAHAVHKVTDRRAVDAMLRFTAAQKSADDFVAATRKKFHEQNGNKVPPNSPKSATPNKRMDESAIHTRATTLPPPIIQPSVSNATKPKSSGYQWLVAGLAAGLLIGCGLGAVLVLKFSEASQQANFAKDNAELIPNKSDTNQLPEKQPEPSLAESSPDQANDKFNNSTDGNPFVKRHSDDAQIAGTPNPVPEEALEPDENLDTISDLAPPRNPMANRPEGARKPRDAEIPQKALAAVPEPEKQAPAIANLKSSRDAVWNRHDLDPTELVRVRVGENFRLAEGSASVEFDDGVILKMLAPAAFEVNDSGSVKVTEGQFLVETPREASEFTIFSPEVAFTHPANLRLIMDVRPGRDSESFVSRGTVNQTPFGQFRAEPMELSRNKLNHSLVRNHPQLSSVSLAQGNNRFLGQIGNGDEKVQLRSRTHFGNVLDRVESYRVLPPNLNRLEMVWPEFAEKVNQLPANTSNKLFENTLNQFLKPENIFDAIGNMSDDFGNGSSSFQGSLSINGVEHKFDSKEEFEKARKKMFGNMPGFRSMPFGNFQGSNSFKDDSTFQVNGLPLEFSSPQVFRDLRKKFQQVGDH